MIAAGSRWIMAVHGLGVELECTVGALESSLDVFLDDFCIDDFPKGSTPAHGTIHPYNDSEVSPNLCKSAHKIGQLWDEIDIYEDDGRFWIVDDRWGMSHIDPRQNQWQTWIVPEPAIEAMRLVELSVMWPMAQLLRSQGLHLTPAISAVRDGFAVLVICPFGIEPELSAMIDSGYKIIGQRWTALREEDGRIAMLQMPGRVQRAAIAPRLRDGRDEDKHWIDVTRGYLGSSQNHAFCDAVVIVEPGRRNKAQLREKTPEEAADLLRQKWPTKE
jgi:hypothetical protein